VFAHDGLPKTKTTYTLGSSKIELFQSSLADNEYAPEPRESKAYSVSAIS
jgi:hypothetical protein